MKPKRLLAFDALEGALKRAYATEGSGEDGYAPLAESLWWIDYLNESFWFQDAGYRHHRLASEGGRLINTLRYARNRHVHNPGLKSMHWPDEEFGIAEGRWRWRMIDDLPRDAIDDPDGRSAYADLIEGRSVFDALVGARDFLIEWFDQLDY